MGFLDDAQDMLGKGVSVAKGAVSSVALEQLGFVKAVCRLCSRGADAGYHEYNGGNVSYLLDVDDVAAAEPFLDDQPRQKVMLEKDYPALAGRYVLVTASGALLANVPASPSSSLALLRLDGTGGSYRVVWGLKQGGHPTSELDSHLLVHENSIKRGGVSKPLLYHAHPENAVAFSVLMPSDDAEVSRTLWSAHTEAVVAFPQGIGALPFMVPGSSELAHATSEKLEHHDACIWRHHGVFASAATADDALGVVQSVDKAAGIYLRVIAASQGSCEGILLTAEDIRGIASAYGLPLREEYLQDA